MPDIPDIIEEALNMPPRRPVTNKGFPYTVKGAIKISPNAMSPIELEVDVEIGATSIDSLIEAYIECEDFVG